MENIELVVKIFYRYGFCCVKLLFILLRFLDFYININFFKNGFFGGLVWLYSG